MTKNIFTIIIIALCVQTVFAKSTNPKRKVLFTLGENERVYSNEYRLMQQLNRNKFACIFYDTSKEQYTLVFNGKRIFTTTDVFKNYKFDNLSYLNPDEKNGYIFFYQKDNGYYVNYKGTVNGPFDAVSLREYHYWSNHNCLSCDDYESSNSRMEKGYDYYYRLAGKWYGRKNRKNKKVNFISCYKENGEWYVNANGNVINGWARISDIQQIAENGNYAYSYYAENEKCYVNVNGNISIGYDYDRNNEIRNVRQTESGNYAYAYKENGKYYININGNISNGYDYTGGAQLTENGKYVYQYREGEKWYINVNGNVSNGYDNPISYVQLTESGKYTYAYQENEKLYVNVNGNVSNGYEALSEYKYTDTHMRVMLLTESGKYAYTYKENEKYYININGNVSGYTRDGNYIPIYNVRLTESGKYAYTYRENGKFYVNINGNIKGGYNGISDVQITDKGNYSFLYDAGAGKIYKNENGKMKKTNLTQLFQQPKSRCFGHDKWNPQIDISSSDKKHSFSSSYKNDYVVINDKHYGKSPAIYAWYDRTKKSFIWNALEGKELVVYEYKLK